MVEPRIRVAAYVTRHRDVPELLVFDQLAHPEAGTQIPAGGVRPGERLEEAALREAREETGLRTAQMIAELAVEEKPHPVTGQPRRTTFFYLEVPDGTPDGWIHRVGGDDTDAGLAFSCRFLPLPLRRPLADDQDRWLDRVDSNWRTRSAAED